MSVYMCGSCLDKFISTTTWLSKQKFLVPPLHISSRNLVEIHTSMLLNQQYHLQPKCFGPSRKRENRIVS